MRVVLLPVCTALLAWTCAPCVADWQSAADYSLQYLNAMRSGALPETYPIMWRSTSGTQNHEIMNFTQERAKSATQVQSVALDLSGGFYTGGLIGAVKITSHVALTTTMLAWSVLDFAKFWTQDPKRLAAALDIISHGLAYITECYIANPFNQQANTTLARASEIVYLVGDVEKESKTIRRPEDITEKQPIETVASGALSSDLSAQMSSAFVSAALALYDRGETSASEARTSIEQGVEMFRQAANLDSQPPPALQPYTNEAGVSATMLPQFYPSTHYYDDLFFASTWLYRATTMNFRAHNRTAYFDLMHTYMDLAFKEGDVPAVNPDYLNNVALVHAASITDDPDFHMAAQSFLWDWICSGEVKYTPEGRARYFLSPNVGDTVTAAAIATAYVQQARTRDSANLSQNFADGVSCFVQSQGLYVLGEGELRPMMIGYSIDTYTRTIDGTSMCPKYPLECVVDEGFEGDDYNLKTGALLWAPEFSDEVPDKRKHNVTVTSLDNNWGATMLFAGLALEEGFSWDVECPAGANLREELPMCLSPRPLSTRLGPTQVAPEEEVISVEKEDDTASGSVPLVMSLLIQSIAILLAITLC